MSKDSGNMPHDLGKTVSDTGFFFFFGETRANLIIFFFGGNDCHVIFSLPHCLSHHSLTLFCKLYVS